ncbi:type II toxin-antitoxin system VapC family toxin [Candidatus Poribacteria bacterium]|nr:type II toxin-antitoxin system VapC family toxin [Candidatus Poribacteria bacterium]
MNILDTHVWIWWLSNPEKLSRKAREIIEKAISKERLYVSSMSVWETTMLVHMGRLELYMDVKDWIFNAESLPYFNFIPVNNNIAIKSVRLPDFNYKDPVDRIIVATAMTIDATLITRDEKILDYPHIKSIW